MKHNIIFLNNKAMEETGVLDMHAAIEDVKNAYILNHKQDVINPGKCFRSYQCNAWIYRR